MSHPGQALFLHAFKLSWPALLTQIAAALCMVFLIDLALDPDVDSRSIIEATDLVLLSSIAFLYVATLHGLQKSGHADSSLGFPYRAEFSLPVATSTLLFVPLLYFCLLMQIGLFAPGIVLNYLFLNVEVSYSAISFIIFQLTIVPLMLTWWTNNKVASLLGWLLGFYLYTSGYLMPEFTREEDSWVIATNAVSDYLGPLLLTAAMGLVTYFGVKAQRSGGGFGSDETAGFDATVLRSIIPLLSSNCPVDSPLRAEIWKERQLSGELRAILGGLAGAAISLLILTAIRFFVPNSLEPINAANFTVLSVSVYLSVCIGLTVYMFGVRYRSGVARIGVYDRSTALSTATLCSVRVAVALCSTLLAGIIMAVTLWILGPLVVAEFDIIQDRIIESLSVISEQGRAAALLQMVLLLLGFLTGITLLSVALTWFMLHSRKVAVGLSLTVVYAFLLTTSLDIFVEGGSHSFAITNTVIDLHIWAALLILPVAMGKMLRDILRDSVISRVQLLWLCIAATAPFALYLVWLFSSTYFDVLEKDFSAAGFSYLLVQGTLPLLAAILSLWTSHRLRHN